MKKTLVLISLCLCCLKSFCQLTDGAMHFDGNSYIFTNGSYSPGSGNITIEAWVKLDTFPINGYPILSSRNNNGSMGFALLVNHWGDVAVFFGLQQVVGSTLGLCFQHIAFVRDNYDTRIYFDGTLVRTQTDTAIQNINSNTPLYFGSDVNISTYLKGSLKEIRVWNSARTATEIATNMNIPLTGNPPHLAGYWRLDDTTQVIHDYSSSHQNATSVGATPISTDSLCGLPIGTGIQENEKSFFITENPVENYWVLNSVSSSKNISLSVFNLEGKMIYEKYFSGNESISFGEGFIPGIYLAKISFDDKVQNLKLIKR